MITLEQLIASIDQAGDFMVSLNGERVYFPSVSIYYTSAELRGIADELDRRDGEWDRQQMFSVINSNDDMRDELL